MNPVCLTKPKIQNMILFNWMSKDAVIQNADITAMTRPQLIKRIEEQRKVINSHRKFIHETLCEVRRLKEVCDRNFDTLPQELKNLIK